MPNSGAKRLNTELNPICHLLALLGGATIVVFSRLRVTEKKQHPVSKWTATWYTKHDFLKFSFLQPLFISF